MKRYLDDRVVVHAGDSRDVLAGMGDASIDSVVCDPPYGLMFMGRAWDALDGAPFAVEFWREVLRVLKPGGHMLAFSGTRTYHRMVVAIEDSGFEIRDQLAWLFGSGFPKSRDISKDLDRVAGVEREVVGTKRVSRILNEDQIKGDNYAVGVEARGGTVNVTTPATDAARQWQGWGSALKPAHEPIVLARKPLIGTLAANVLAHGTGGINVDGCRVGTETLPAMRAGSAQLGTFERHNMVTPEREGRFPANVIHDGSEEVIAGFPDARSAGIYGNERNVSEGMFGKRTGGATFSDDGSAARFYYTAKADADDRLGSKHPTVKPLDLMQYLCRLITPPGGTVLDPFAGTGTTGEAAWREGFNAILIEREPEYLEDIARRLDLAANPSKRAAVAKTKNQIDDLGPLFSIMEPAE